MLAARRAGRHIVLFVALSRDIVAIVATIIDLAPTAASGNLTVNVTLNASG